MGEIDVSVSVSVSASVSATDRASGHMYLQHEASAIRGIGAEAGACSGGEGGTCSLTYSI